MAKRVKKVKRVVRKYRVVAGKRVYAKAKSATKRRVRKTQTRKTRKSIIPCAKPGDAPISARSRAACLKNDKRRSPDIYTQLMCRERKTRGVVAKYRRILTAVNPVYFADLDDEEILRYWGESLRQLVGPFSATAAQEAAFIKYAKANGLHDDAATGDAIQRALSPKDRALVRRAFKDE